MRTHAVVVSAVAGDGVVVIHDSTDQAEFADLVALAAVNVAGTVVTFMV